MIKNLLDAVESKSINDLKEIVKNTNISSSDLKEFKEDWRALFVLSLVDNKESFNYCYQSFHKGGSISAKIVNNLGDYYYEGIGCKQSYEIALELFKKACDMGDPNAAYNLGHYYSRGIVVNMDEKKALEYYKLGSLRGNLDATRVLGMWYAIGIGCQQDFKMSYQYHKLASDKGDLASSFTLSLYHIHGIGCQKNIQLAEMYKNKVKGLGVQESQMISMNVLMLILR